MPGWTLRFSRKEFCELRGICLIAADSKQRGCECAYCLIAVIQPGCKLGFELFDSAQSLKRCAIAAVVFFKGFQVALGSKQNFFHVVEVLVVVAQRPDRSGKDVCEVFILQSAYEFIGLRSVV